ncbi:MAG: isopeptide-forming domain-containing fimbrial protein [Eggerthellaceae bacterium]|nr:isopeptide-forming domain-containing fimbrial protein [Eggerthellaceae bacterium]
MSRSHSILKRMQSVLVAFCLAAAAAFAFVGNAQFAQAADTTVNSWAELKSAVESASSGDTITLGSDLVVDNNNPITVTQAITIAGDATIFQGEPDANGKYQTMFTVNGGDLTIDTGVTLSGMKGESGMCPDGDTYTSDNFTGTLSEDGTTYDPKGFFIQVDKGSATLKGTLSDFVTSRNKATTPRYVAPVVANGKTATFNIDGGTIKNNLVGYIVDDNKANQDAQSIKQYVKGAGPNVPRVPNAATQKANKDSFDRARNKDALIDEGVPGTGITATAGAVIYKDGAQGTITSGTITNNRADTGGIMVSGEGTEVTISDVEISKNVGVQFGGGSTAEQGGVINMSGGKMEYNVAWFGGGAVYATENGVDWLQGRMNGADGLSPQFDDRLDGEFNMSGGSLNNNTALTRGGAILADSDAVHVTAGKLQNNMSRMLGGAVYVMGDHPLYTYTMHLTGLYVHDNTAVSGIADARQAAANGPDSKYSRAELDALNNTLQTKLEAPNPCADVPDDILGDVFASPNSDDMNDGWGTHGTGGGVWLCAYGTTYFDAGATDQVVIADNYATGAVPLSNSVYPRWVRVSSDGKTIREDIAYNTANSVATGTGRTGGNDIHADTGDSGKVIIKHVDEYTGWMDENASTSENVRYLDPVSEGRVNMVNVGPITTMENAFVEVSGNVARRGGGLAADGTFMLGMADDQATMESAMQVSKAWTSSAAKKPVAIRVNAQSGTNVAVVADVPLDGEANAPVTEFDTIEELAPTGNTWNGRFKLPIELNGSEGKIKVFSLVLGEAYREEGDTDGKIDPTTYDGRAKLAAAIKSIKDKHRNPDTGEVDEEAAMAELRRALTVSFNDDLQFTCEEYEMEYDSDAGVWTIKMDGGQPVKSRDYVFSSKAVDLSKASFELQSTSYYGQKTDPDTGEVYPVEIFQVHLFGINLTLEAQNDNNPIAEKYVNKQVHSDIVKFDQEFTYDIMAYVPYDATEFTISDTLVDGLEFANANGAPSTNANAIVSSIVVKAQNNHEPGENGSVSLNGEPDRQGHVLNLKPGSKYTLPSGKAITCNTELNVDGNTLTVRVPEGDTLDVLRGKWVQVTFNARIKDEYRNLDALNALASGVEKPSGETTSWEGTETDKQGSPASVYTTANGDLALIASLKSAVGPDDVIWAVEAPSRLFARTASGDYYATPMNDKSGNTWQILDPTTDDGQGDQGYGPSVWTNADNRYNGRAPHANNTVAQIDLEDAKLDALKQTPKIKGSKVNKAAEGANRLFAQTTDAEGAVHIWATPNNDKSGKVWNEVTAADGNVYSNALKRLSNDRFTLRMLDLVTESITLDPKESPNWPVISEESHEGMANQADYTVKFANRDDSNHKTNTVTVAPETTELEVAKKWETADGAWPDDVDKVTFGIYAVKGTTETPVYMKDGKVVPAGTEGAKELTVEVTKTTTDLKETVDGLPRLKGVRYIAREIKVGDNDVVYDNAKTTGRSPDDVPTVFTAMASKLTDTRFAKLAEKTGVGDMPLFGAKADNRLFAMTESGKFYVTYEGDTTGAEADTEWTLVKAPTNMSTDAEAALYKRAVSIFNKTADSAVEVVEITEGFTATNTKPQVEKYVNNKVHTDLTGFDSEFTYSVMAYVPANATKVILKDTLTKDLQFVNTDPSKVLSEVHVYKTNDHVGKGSGTVSTTSGDNFIRSAAAVANNTRQKEKPVDQRDYKIEVKDSDKTVWLTLDEGFLNEIRTKEAKVKDAEDKSFWVKMSFKAKINPDSYADVLEKITSGDDSTINTDADPTALWWKKVEDDGSVKEGADVDPDDGSHAGLLNKASYQVFIGNTGSSEIDTNTVTVKPKTTKLEVVKQWVDKSADPDDATKWTTSYKWPTGSGEPESINIKLLLDGKEMNTYDWWAATGLEAIKSMTAPTPNDGSAASKVTFEGLPVLEGKTYTIDEAFMPDGCKHYMPSIFTKNGVTTITNQEEHPQVEKYVNQDVHADLAAFNEIFTYDILAYVPSDATEFEITDTLEKTLWFVSAADDVTIKVLGPANDHKTTVKSEGTPLAEVDANVQVTKSIDPEDASTLGEDVVQKLTVSATGIADGSGVRGKWVKVTFKAQIRDSYRTMDALTGSGTWAAEDDDKTTQRQFKDASNPNAPVDSDKVHEGVKNKADYKVKVGNDSDFKYDYDTNTVTVKPVTEDIEITKKWSDGTAANPAEGAVDEETFKSWLKLIKIADTAAEDVTQAQASNLAVTKNTNGTYTAKWTGLPCEYINPENPDAGLVRYVVQEDVAAAEAAGFKVSYTGKANTEGAKFEDDTEVGDAVNNGGTITNGKTELEKYINKNVHKFVGLDEVFTYDIIAFVTDDADELQITDQLNKQLQFAKSGADVRVYDMGTTNNHMTSDKAAEEGDTATVTNRGTPITKATINTDNNTLTVTLANVIREIDNTTGTISYSSEDLTPYRGHYIRVEFKAQLADSVVTAVEGSASSIEQMIADGEIDVVEIGGENEPTNDPLNVTDAQTQHSGIENDAQYTIKVANEGKYSDSSNTVTVVPEKPEIEKYVAQDVHADICLDTVFTYDILAYVTSDADKVTITDELVSDLEFKDDANTEVTVVDIGTSNHKTNGVYTATNDDASVSEAGEAISPAEAVVININGQFLTVSIANDATDASKQYLTPYRGHWLKVTFRAQIKKSLQDAIKAGTKTLDDLENTTITATDEENRAKPNVGNAPVVSDKDHEGISNKANYEIEVDNEGKYSDESNTVTVKPQSVELSVSKEWFEDGVKTSWPEGATIEAVVLNSDDDVVATQVLSATKPSHTFTNLPVLEDNEYSITEGEVVGTSLFNTAQVETEDGTTYVITNSSSVPKIEKYVNQKVHAELETFDEPFTYDIMAYVPEGATKIVISDTLIPQLDLLSTAEEIEASAVTKAENNHTVDGVEGIDASVVAAGDPVNVEGAEKLATATVGEKDEAEGTPVEVTVINDNYVFDGMWVQVTLKAQICKDAYADVAKKLDEDPVSAQENINWARIQDNTPVQQGDEDHSGLLNKASYKLYVDTEGSSDYETNTVTVKPKRVKTTVEKQWLAADGTSMPWPDGVESVSMKVVYANDTETQEEVIELTPDAPKQETREFNRLTGAEFTITEITQTPGFTTGEATGDADNGFVVTNTATGPEIEKYVNQAVHKEIDYTEVFTYDILAYITPDADSATITDVLDEQLQFACTSADITAVSYEDDNHLPRNDVYGNAIVENADATVASSGEKIEGYDVTIDGGRPLIVEIPDATSLRNKWVKVTFTAKLADDADLVNLQYIDIDATTPENRSIPNVGNDPVVSDESHTGIPNKASYTIGVKNSAGVVVDRHNDESNTVTVKPKSEPTNVGVVVNKFIRDTNGNELDPEENAFTFTLNIEGPNNFSLTQNTTNNESGGTVARFEVDGLVSPGEYKYTVTEQTGTDADMAYDTTVLSGSFYVAEFVIPTGRTQGFSISAVGTTHLAFAIRPATADDIDDGSKYKRILAVVDAETYASYDGKVQMADTENEIATVRLVTVGAGEFNNVRGGEQYLSVNASTVTKTWNDGGNDKDRAPVTFQLYCKVGEGAFEPVEGKTVTISEPDENGVWAATFEKLPAYVDGEPASYYAVEANAADFTGLYTPGEEIVIVDLESTSGMGATNHPFTPRTSMDINFSKRATGSVDGLEGAKLQVLDYQGKVVEEWTSGKDPHVISDMPVGLYKLHEVSAPNGFALASDIEFRVNVDDTVEVKDGNTWKAYDTCIVMYDKPTTPDNSNTPTNKTGSSTTAKTSDTAGLPTAVLGMIALLGLAGALATARRVRR